MDAKNTVNELTSTLKTLINESELLLNYSSTVSMQQVNSYSLGLFLPVYSLAERILFEFFLALSTVASTLVNGLVLAAILKDSRLHTPEIMIIGADA